MYAKEEVFKETKSESLRKVRVWKNRLVEKVVMTLKNNKFLVATMGAFILFSMVNAMMICTFFRILQRV